MGDKGVEHHAGSPGNLPVLAIGVTESVTLPADADLARLTATWPTLPPNVRRAVLALIDMAGN